MGALRKKLGLKFSYVLISYVSIGLFVALAMIIQYIVFRNYVTYDIKNTFKYFSYISIIIAVVIFVVYYLRQKFNVPISLHENGIFLKKTKQSIMYTEISNFYFTPNSANKINRLVVEKINGDKFTFDTSYVGEDFMEYFQQDYDKIHLSGIIDKVEHGYEFKYGLISSKQKALYSIIQTKSMAKNVNFSEEFTLSKDFFKYEGENYLWGDIVMIHDIRSGKIEIVNKKTQKNILETYIPYVEKGQTSFNVMDHFIDEAREKFQTNEDKNVDFTTDSAEKTDSETTQEQQ